MEGMKLEVTYSYPGIVVELDDKIRKFFKELGFDNWASGYDMNENIRDLAFDYKGEK